MIDPAKEEVVQRITIVQVVAGEKVEFSEIDMVIYTWSDAPFWGYWTPEISTGCYPLEKLPYHVRGLAKELYY